MTPDQLVAELDRVVKVPGLANIWVPPIRNRIDMLATGIKARSASRSQAAIWHRLSGPPRTLSASSRPFPV